MTPELREQLALLPLYLGNHIRLSVLAILIGIAISLPLSILATRFRRLEWPLLSVANVLQTVPALALLAFMVPLLGRIGFVPALIALVLYSMLPVVRNTITGIHQVDPSLIEAGKGLGMTDAQLLLRVELPLAAPTILAGIRIAVVWVVGIATLSTPVGAPSLGNYIFSGL
ncbi:MAG: ABC transporter permease, partial [Acidobacteriota bacterium]